MDSTLPNIKKANKLIKEEMVKEFLSFWEKIPGSELQKLADQALFDKALQRWENQAKTYYQKYQMKDNEVEVIWHDNYWNTYRSISIKVNRLGMIHFPYTAFRFQAINPRSYEYFWKEFQKKKSQTIQQLMVNIWELSRNLVAELNPVEVLLLQTSINELEDDHFQATGWFAPQYFVNKIKIPETQISKNLKRLYACGILQSQVVMNYGRLGLIPKLLVSKRPLESLEDDYCYCHLFSPKNDVYYSSIAVPPGAIEMGWDQELSDSESLKDISIFVFGWNLSHLTKNGWIPYSKDLTIGNAISYIKINYNEPPLKLTTTDIDYLEKSYQVGARGIRGEKGPRAQSQVKNLGKQGAFKWIPTYRSLGLASSIFIHAVGSQEVLQEIIQRSKVFPLFRYFLGKNWILIILTIPDAWIYKALLDFTELSRKITVESFNIDVHPDAVERFLPLQKLWDTKRNEWIAA